MLLDIDFWICLGYLINILKIRNGHKILDSLAKK
jgi:hypothetical protein